MDLVQIHTNFEIGRRIVEHEYQLYLPSKEQLRKKLVEWTEVRA